jgi:hypothetical protein
VELVWEDSATSAEHLGEELYGRIAALLVKVMESDAAAPPEKRFTVRFA